jgi:multidrug efflux pump subunit AcrA (membrane-fusion protein)
MTSTTTAQDALDAAEAAYRSTQGAVDSARAAASRQALDDAETAAAEAIAAAATGEGDRATADAARERVEKMRRDFAWAEVELQAAETAMSRAADGAARAHRGVVAEEYLSAHKTHNDTKTRMNVLLAQLPDLLAELVPLVATRDELHRRLDQELRHFPHDERPAIPTGQPLTAPDAGATPLVMVQVPRGAIASAIEAGLAAAGH